jgi:site-specific DNA-methyltransferase (adenine-specific)
MSEIIYADPPWLYKDPASAGKRGAAHKYPCLTLPDLMKLNIDMIAAPNCALFLWATLPMLPEAFEVLKAWRFKYRTVAFTWVKSTKGGKYFFGMGHWTRGNPELCLLATRGKIRRVNAGVPQLVVSQRLAHSAKPILVRERIVKLMGERPRIELFARTVGAGWSALGNDLDGRDIREILKPPTT